MNFPSDTMKVLEAVKMEILKMKKKTETATS